MPFDQGVSGGKCYYEYWHHSRAIVLDIDLKHQDTRWSRIGAPKTGC